MLLSISAVTLTEGNRVAVKHDANSFYVGTVVRVTPTGCRVKYDDNGEVKLERGTLIRLQDKTKKIKTEQYKHEIAKLKYVAPPKPVASPGRKVRPTARPTITIKKTATKRILVRAKKPAETKGENPLVQKVGNERMYNMGHTGTIEAIKLNYIKHVWVKLNELYFENKIPIPFFKLMKNMKNFRGLGYWFGSKRLLAISPRVFNPDHQNLAVTVIAHEVCHQMVSEIDGVVREPNKGHGPLWSGYMTKLGLVPAQYFDQDTKEQAMTEDEKVEKSRIVKNKEQAKRVAEKLGNKQISPSEDMPAQYHDPKSNQWVKGLIVGPQDRAGKKWMFLKEPSFQRYMIVPATWFYSLETRDYNLYSTKEFKQAALSLRTHQRMDKIAKAARRQIVKKVRSYGW